ncbi:hypothetical protein [Cupriavidus basilensis]|uniref:hypothetical protein n=1 Tax=Cupriavidus basilensis TaxID=68895 RepID=UPI002840FA13|nr:hypothetical protein [Cupriavidus basilensis]MDR3381774.1 hypothetical protein [Cupriavidus basilensis]
MSDLLNNIRAAQVHAAENVVIESLRSKGLIFDDEPKATAAPFVDLQGLAAALMAPREICRTADGLLMHPGLPVWDEDVRADLFLAAFGLESEFVGMESDCKDQALLDRYFEQGDPDCSGWTPTPPQGDGWMLLEIYDTEDGPYAMFARKKPAETRRQYLIRKDAEANTAKAVRFAGMVFEAHRNDGEPGDLDGDVLQDMAETCGLLASRKVTERCGEHCACDDLGALPCDCLFPTAAGNAAVSAARAADATAVGSKTDGA